MTSTTNKTVFMRKVLKQMSLSVNTGVNQKKQLLCNQNCAEGSIEEFLNHEEII